MFGGGGGGGEGRGGERGGRAWKIKTLNCALILHEGVDVQRIIIFEK